MYLEELLMQNELAELNSEMEKGARHINDLRSGAYSFDNESAITRLQNKIYQISEDLKDLILDGYLSALKDIGHSMSLVKEKEVHYNSLLIKLDKELSRYRNSLAKYIQLNFRLPA